MRLKDLNATPKLMGSFAVMIVITLGVGYLSINSLGKSNERLEALYKDEMIGAEQASDFNKQRLLLSRDSRDAILMVRDADAVAESERQATDGLARLHSLLDDMDKTFYTPAGKEIVATLRNALPAYERAYHDLYRRLHARDAAGAAAMLKEVSRLGNALGENADRAVAMKTQHGKDSFDANATSFATTRNLVLAVSALAAALGLLLSFIIARGFAVPLGKAAAALEHLAQGDLTAYLDLDSEDEVGRLGASFNRAVKSLNETMQEVSENAEQAASSSQQLASAAEAIASGAQEQAASLEQTSASLEQITATVRQSADNAHQASQLASGSRTSAEKGQDVVSAAITAMNEINAASAKISDITSTIDEIAFQTNLLAVNAAVEAARAGEEGRGFAVVATEVRSLAQRSAGAAKEIKVLIQDSLKKVETGSVLVNKSGETLQGIVGSVKRVTDIVGEIAASTSEQSTGVEQVSTAVTQMDQVTQSNSAQTEELSATAQALSEQATRLQEMVATFTLQNPAESAGSPLRKTPRGTEKTQVGRVDIISPKNASAAGSKHRPAGRDSKPKVVRQPVVLTGSGARDESFAEF